MHERGWLLLLVVGGLVLSTASYRHLERLEYRATSIAFESRARDQVTLIEHTLARAIDAVLAVADLMHTQPEIDQRDFDRFGQLLLARQPSLGSLGYSRWTAPEEVGMVLGRLRAEGFPVTEVTARTAVGMSRRSASDTAEHRLILTRLTPAELAPDAVGADIAALPDRRDVALQARDAGEPRMSGLLQLSGRAADGPGVLVFAPVYRGDQIAETVEERKRAFAGAASIGLVIEPVLRQVLSSPEDALVRIIISNHDEQGDTTVLFDSAVPSGRQGNPDKLTAHPLAEWHKLRVAGTTWHVQATPTPEFIVRRSDIASELALIFGIAITFLAALLLALAFRHRRTIERSLAEREMSAVELSRVNDALETANREMEEFVSAVSHDLRNPLHTMTGVRHLLEIGIESGDTRTIRQGIESLGRSTSAMNRIIDDLLEHSRAGWAPLVHEAVDLAELVRRLTAERSDAIAARSATVELLELPVIRGDPRRLAAAIDNLLGNALKYGCNGISDRQPLIRVGSRIVGDETWIFVSDNGPGVPHEDRQRIFGLFHRLDARGSGTGLGLAIVERVARAHEGRAWVEDTPGGGATFIMAFPRELA